MSLGSFASSNVFEPGGRDTKQDRKSSYAARARNDLIFSLDFEQKGDRNIAYASRVGKILEEVLGVKQEEIEGVHRSSIFAGKGYMKIKMKERIDVNRRFAKTRGRAEDEDVKVLIKGIRTEGKSKIIRIISPNEDVPLFRIKRQWKTSAK